MVSKCFYKKLLAAILKMKLFLIKNQEKNYTNQLLENLIKEKYDHLLLTVFGVQIQQIHSLISNFNKRFRFILFAIDIYSKYPRTIPLKKVRITILMLLRKFQMNQNTARLSPKDVNQIKYGLIKIENFIIDQ